MAKIPTVGIDSTLALVTDGYQFISKRCQQQHSDIFQTRLLLEKTICLKGAEAASIFYDVDKFSRKKAAPKRLQKTLLGEGGVQGLDGDRHQHRKQLFMALMSAERIDLLAEITRQQWQVAAEKWAEMERVTFFPAARSVLFCAVCEWSGVPLAAAEVESKTRDTGAMIDSSGAIGLEHWQGKRARVRMEEWLGGLIEQVRAGRLEAPEDSALWAMAQHRDLTGNLLDKRIAAVDLLNVLRPTVAIARYVTFAALTLHKHPEYREKLRTGDEQYVEQFVQEVRRYYPFFPFASARVKESFDWSGFHFPKGRRVLLDLYGTNHDAHLWHNPDEFQPERFQPGNEGPDGRESENKFKFIPQGGGDFYTNHRCAGEWITITLMKRAMQFLTEIISYDVPSQDLSLSLSQMPTLPKSGFVISNVRINSSDK